MSHSFTIAAVEGLQFDDIIAELGAGEIVLKEAAAVQAGAWPVGTVFLYIDNVSVRAVEVDYTGDVLTIRLFLGACPDDYRLATRLAEVIARRHNALVEADSAAPLSADQFAAQFGEEWIGAHCDEMVDAMIHAYQRHGELQLSGVRATLTLGKRFMEPLLQNRARFAENFFRRFRVLNYIDRRDAFVASVIVFATREGSEYSMSVLSEGVPTVISDRPDFVDLRSRDGRHYFMTHQHFVEVLGDDAFWISNELMLTPNLEGMQWQHFLDKAMPYTTTEPSSVNLQRLRDSVGDIHAPTNSPFTDAEWHQLLLTPVYVLNLAVGVASGVDEAEIRTLKQTLQAADDAPNYLVRHVFRAALLNIERLLDDGLTARERPGEGLLRTANIVETHLDSNDAREFKLGLLQLGMQFAMNTDGNYVGLKTRISRDGQLALNALARMLGVETNTSR